MSVLGTLGDVKLRKSPLLISHGLLLPSRNESYMATFVEAYDLSSYRLWKFLIFLYYEFFFMNLVGVSSSLID